MLSSIKIFKFFLVLYLHYNATIRVFSLSATKQLDEITTTSFSSSSSHGVFIIVDVCVAPNVHEIVVQIEGDRKRERDTESQ